MNITGFYKVYDFVSKMYEFIKNVALHKLSNNTKSSYDGLNTQKLKFMIATSLITNSFFIRVIFNKFWLTFKYLETYAYVYESVSI